MLFSSVPENVYFQLSKWCILYFCVLWWYFLLNRDFDFNSWITQDVGLHYVMYVHNQTILSKVVWFFFLSNSSFLSFYLHKIDYYCDFQKSIKQVNTDWVEHCIGLQVNYIDTCVPFLKVNCNIFVKKTNICWLNLTYITVLLQLGFAEKMKANITVWNLCIIIEVRPIIG